MAAWNPLDHPRGADGRFIKVGDWVRWLDPLTGLWKSGEVQNVNLGVAGITRNNVSTGETESSKIYTNKLYRAARPKAVIDPTKMIRVSGQLGSNPGGMYQDPDGAKWYIKQPRTKLHASNENLAARLYSAVGAFSPRTAVSPDGKRFMSRIEDSVPWYDFNGEYKDSVFSELRRNFVVDAWLSNWDAPHNDNVRITPDGRVLRADSGGAIHFRARGDVRPHRAQVTELQSMRDPSVSSSGSRMYAGLTRDEELDGAKRIMALTPAMIRQTVSEEGMPDVVADNLLERRSWLAEHYGLTLPEDTPEGLAQIVADEPVSPKAPSVEELLKPVPAEAQDLTVGASVWVNARNDKDNPAGKIRKLRGDVGVVTAIDSVGGDTMYTVRDSAGKEWDFLRDEFEVLRKNKASENSKLTSGEVPQIAQRVEFGGTAGNITELFPMYARVQFDDGSDKVVQTKKLNPSDTERPENVVPLQIGGEAIGVGTPLDLKRLDQVGKEEVWAYSVMHRAEGLVLDNDKIKQQAFLLFGNKSAWVPYGKLLEPETVDKDLVKQLPTKKSRTPRAPKQLDVSTLPPKTVVLHDGEEVTLNSGDRLLAFSYRRRRRGKVNMILHPDGELTMYLGGETYSSSDPRPSHISTIHNVLQGINSGYDGTLRDITPAKYDQAAFVKASNPKLQLPTSVSSKLRVELTSDYDENGRWLSHSERKHEEWVSPEVMLPAGAVLAYWTKDVKAIGKRRDRSGQMEDVEVPRVFMLTRDKKAYDLGYGGEHADDPFLLDDDSAEAVAWSKTYSYGTDRLGTKTVKTRDGEKQVSYDDISRYGYEVSDAGISRASEYLHASKQYGSTGVLSHNAKGWDKGDPALKKAAADARAAAAPSAPAEDLRESAGAKALFHQMGGSREKLLAGEFDAAAASIFDTEYKSDPRSGLLLIADGTVHKDPYMATMVSQMDGDQQAMVLDQTAFNALRKKSGSPLLYRGVDNQAQADALREGAYFNGSGMYGNGTYTSDHTRTANSYGSAQIQMAYKESAKVIDFDDAQPLQLEDLFSSQAERFDALHDANPNLPGTNELAGSVPAYDDLDPEEQKIFDQFVALRNHTVPSQLSAELLDAGATGTEQYKAALLYALGVYKSSGLRPTGVTTEGYSASSYNVLLRYATGPSLENSFILRFTKSISTTRLTRSQARTGKQVAMYLDERIQGPLFDGKIKPQVRYPGANTNPKKHDLSLALELAGALSPTDDQRKKLRGLDARLSFIEDPGRWALLSGYDVLSAAVGGHYPGSEKYYILLHRTAAFFKKKRG
jgi:hypothetical protein